MEQYEERVDGKKRALRKYKKTLGCLNRLQARLDSVEPGSCDAQELKERIDRVTARSEEIRRKVLFEIDRLDDPEAVEILERFFVGCETFEEIAEDLTYSTRQVVRIYTKSLADLTEED